MFWVVDAETTRVFIGLVELRGVFGGSPQTCPIREPLDGAPFVDLPHWPLVSAFHGAFGLRARFDIEQASEALERNLEARPSKRSTPRWLIRFTHFTGGQGHGEPFGQRRRNGPVPRRVGSDGDGGGENGVPSVPKSLEICLLSTAFLRMPKVEVMKREACHQVVQRTVARLGRCFRHRNAETFLQRTVVASLLM